MKVFQPQVFLRHNCTLQGNQNKYQPNKLQIFKNKLILLHFCKKEKYERLTCVLILL